MGGKGFGCPVLENARPTEQENIDAMVLTIENMKDVLFESYKYAKSKGDQELLLFFITAFSDQGCFNARRERIERYHERKVLGSTANTSKGALFGIYNYELKIIDEDNALKKDPLTQYLKENALEKDYADGNSIKQITEQDISEYVDAVAK